MQRAAIYLRVSTQKQELENQRPDLERAASMREFELVRVYEEQASSVDKRPVFEQLRKDAQRGKFDVVIVWALDRLGRSMLDNIRTVLELEQAGVHVVSLREQWMDTRGPVRDLLLAIFSWVAEQERTRLVERTKAGLERARREGKKLGRPRVGVSRFEVEMLHRQGVSANSISRRLGISRASTYRLLLGLKNPPSLSAPY
jgi:putative DNA-invertase from lambdoid prophage Rac